MTEKQDIIFSNKYDAEKLPKNFINDYFTHILCKKGQAQFELGGKIYAVQPNDIVILLPSSEVKNFLFSIDFECDMFLMSYEIASENNPNIAWGIKGFLFSKENPVVSLPQKYIDIIKHNFKEIKSIFYNTNHLFRKNILGLKIQIFVMNMWQIFSEKISQRLHFQGQSTNIFECFLHLVEAHCMEHREVSFYSGKLCISSKYLSEVCKKSSGKTASEWIQNYTAQRLTVLLKNQQLSLSEISEALHFSSPSFFSRYVKNILGVSPTEYRENMG